MFIDGTYISPDTWYDGDGTPFKPQVHYFAGAATKMYGAALYRLRPEDFDKEQAGWRLKKVGLPAAVSYGQAD